MHQPLPQGSDGIAQFTSTFWIVSYSMLSPLEHVYSQFLIVLCTPQIASRISLKMKFGPLSRPFLQVPIMSLAQKVIVSEPGHEPQFKGRPEQGAALYQAILDDDGELYFTAPRVSFMCYTWQNRPEVTMQNRPEVTMQ